MDAYYVEMGIDIEKKGTLGWEIIYSPSKDSILKWVKQLSDKCDCIIHEMSDDYFEKLNFVRILDETGNSVKVIEFNRDELDLQDFKAVLKQLEEIKN